MNTIFWKVPGWELPLEKGNKVEIFYVPKRDILSEEGWPHSFWSQVQKRRMFYEQEAHDFINLFQGLKVGEPARCHMPPWGMAVFCDTALLFTATLCFECSNAYIYTTAGKELRAFDVEEANAIALLNYFKKYLPLN